MSIDHDIQHEYAALAKWEASVSDNGQYLYVSFTGKPGFIQIKADDEGFVVDIRNEYDEVEASTYSLYQDLEDGN